MLEREKEVGNTKAKIQQFQNEFQRIQDRNDKRRGVIVDDDGCRWEPLLNVSHHVWKTRFLDYGGLNI